MSYIQSKAVLFGINYTDDDERTRLQGCINDVKNMELFLRNKYDVVKTYTDEFSSKKVSADHIIHTLYKLAIDSHRYKLKKVWIHYSGHGCSIEDYSGDESDMKDECIVPADYKTRGIIKDDTIKRILRYFHRETKVVCIFDCCHSGTIGDLRFKYKNIEEIEYENLSSRCQSDIIMISGCLDDQTSSDAYNVHKKREYSGAMTTCLLKALKKSKNLYECLEKTKNDLRNKRFSQIPLLTSSFLVNKNTNLY